MAGVRQFDEAEVLQAVLDVFWRKGWQATSMADLAEASSVQRGSLYNAYGGKEELFLRAFEVYSTRFLDEAKTALSADTAELALRNFFRVAIANMTRGTPAQGCLTTKTATEIEAAGPRIHLRLRQLIDDLKDIAGKAFSKPHIAKDMALPPEDAAEVFVTFTRGLAVMERVYREEPRLYQTADAMIRTLLIRSVK